MSDTTSPPPTNNNHHERIDASTLSSIGPQGQRAATPPSDPRTRQSGSAAAIELPRPERAPHTHGMPAAPEATDPGQAQAVRTPVLCDSRTRRFRLLVAGSGVTGLAGLWGALAFLRDYALHKPVPQPVSGVVGIAGASIQPHPQPTYTVLFLLLSYSIVLAGIVFATATHDVNATRLRIARLRVAEAIADYDQAIEQRVQTPLMTEQAHLDLIDLAPSRLEATRQEHLRWAIDGVKKVGEFTPDHNDWWETQTSLGDPLKSVPSPARARPPESEPIARPQESESI